MLALQHIRCSPHHPQTNRKTGASFHETLKARVNLLPCTSDPAELGRAIEELIEFYNHRRYHEGIGNVAPADVSRLGPETENRTKTRHARRAVSVQSQPLQGNQHGCTQPETVATQCAF